MKRGIVLIGGISDTEYMREQVSKVKEVHRSLLGKYGPCHIHTIDYQPIMDKGAFVAKSLLDPVRLVLNPDGWKAEKFVISELKRLRGMYDTLDVMTHSMGSWIVLKADVKVESLFLIASPIGFRTFVARNIVRMNIGNPKIQTDKLFFIYSKGDLVSCCPPEIKGKWLLNSKYYEVINTGTTHDLIKYLTYLHGHSDLFLPY